MVHQGVSPAVQPRVLIDAFMLDLQELALLVSA